MAGNEHLIADINPEISDDEARTITVQHILIKTYSLNEDGEKVFDGSKIVAGSNVFAEAVKAIYAMLDEETTGAYVSAFTTGDGVYTVEFDVAVSIGGISEKVIVNFDMFGLK